MSKVQIEIFGKATELARFVLATVEAAIARVPERYLAGLRQVLLLHEDRLPRRSRRRHQRKDGDILLGSYFRATRRRTARIELYLDGISRSIEDRAARRDDFTEAHRRGHILHILLHELGHHIAATSSPCHGDREVTAEEWRARLGAEHFSGRSF